MEYIQPFHNHDYTYTHVQEHIIQYVNDITCNIAESINFGDIIMCRCGVELSNIVGTESFMISGVENKQYFGAAKGVLIRGWRVS